MPHTQDRLVLRWILAFASLAIILVVFGGFVRLTRSGLSIVEWNPVAGALPPLTQQDWQIEFSKYQTTPEYQQINRGMSLEAYKEIFIVEWIHRILARFAGLVFAVPFFLFIATRRIPLKESPIYVFMGFLFLAQAVMGWLMVSSGLVERPSVSHYLLASHLFLALSLVGLSVWTGLGHVYGFGDPARPNRWSAGSRLALVGLIALLLQMAYGAFTAGLKAGHVSNTWPLMLGRLIPPGMLDQITPPLLNLVAAPLTVAFIHRWLAVLVLVLGLVSYDVIRRLNLPKRIVAGLKLALVLGLIQIGLGIAVVISGVTIAIALLHQLNAIALFITTVFVLHRLRSDDRARVPAAGTL
jgi:cytochrome c oxidase assembly protein subunit 15